jgi:acetyl-CoA C-acetyltransferase
MTTQRSVVFCSPVRTAIGTFGGSLKDMAAPDLGSIAIKAAVTCAGIKPEEVETAVMGNVVQAGAKMNPARQAAVHAGLPGRGPGNDGEPRLRLGGTGHRFGGAGDRARQYRRRGGWRDGLNDAFSDAASGWHTEDLVEKFRVTREAQDRWALRSQQRFGSAQAAGHFKSQIVPVEVSGKKGPSQFDKNEHNRSDATLERWRV